MPTLIELQKIIENSITVEPFINEKGELIAHYGADEEFPYNITFTFNISGNILYIMADAPDFKIPSKKSNLCFSLVNFLNRTTQIIKVSFIKAREYLYETKIFSELLLSDNINNDYISDFIDFTIENSFRTFEKIYKKIYD